MKLERKLLPSTIIESASDDNKEAFTTLLETLNPTLTDLSRLFTGKVSFADNIACLFRAVQFTYPAPATGTFLNSVTEWGGLERPTRLHKENGWVDFSGLFKHNGTGGAANLYQVPLDYMPKYNETYFPGTSNTVAATYTIVATTGQLRLDGFAAGGGGPNTACSFTHRYEALNPDPPKATGQFPIQVDVTPLNTRPSACIVTKTEIIDGKTIIPSMPLGIIWNATTNGKTDVVKISDFVGAVPGRRYRVGLLFLP